MATPNYGQTRDTAAEGKMAGELKGYLEGKYKQAGKTWDFNPDSWGAMVSATTYGGYSSQDVWRQLGEGQNIIHTDIDKNTWAKAHQDMFPDWADPSAAAAKPPVATSGEARQEQGDIVTKAFNVEDAKNRVAEAFTLKIGTAPLNSKMVADLANEYMTAGGDQAAYDALIKKLTDDKANYAKIGARKIEDPYSGEYKIPDIPGMPKFPDEELFPQIPDLAQIYADMRKSQDMDSLEAGMAQAQDELDALDGAYEEGHLATKRGLAPMAILSGRAQELQEQYTMQRNSKLREIDSYQRRVDTAQNAISMMMDMTQQSYDNARNSYNDKFSHAMQFQEQYYRQWSDEREHRRLLSQDAADRHFQKEQLENTIKKQERDEASAHLTTLYGAFMESGKGWDEISPEHKAQINKLEVQAGLPKNSLQAFSRTKPESTLLGQVSGVDRAGNDIVTFVYADKDGNPGMVYTKKTGGFTDQSKDGNASDATYGLNASIHDKIQGAEMRMTDIGFEFRDSNQNPITGAQYAAFHGKNLQRLLGTSNSKRDEELYNKLFAEKTGEIPLGKQMIYDGDSTVENMYYSAALEYPSLFRGITPDEFAVIMGI